MREWQLCDIWWSPPLPHHASIPQTSDNDARQSQHSVLHNNTIRPGPAPGWQISTELETLPRRSNTWCLLSVSPLHQQTVCMCVLCVRKMIYCKFWVQTMQLFSPGTCACAGAWSLVPADDWLLPSPKIKTVKRDAVCSKPGFLVTRRELIIWIRKRDPRTLTELSLSAITTIFAGFSSEPLPSPMSMSRWIKD